MDVTRVVPVLLATLLVTACQSSDDDGPPVVGAPIEPGADATSDDPVLTETGGDEATDRDPSEADEGDSALSAGSEPSVAANDATVDVEGVALDDLFNGIIELLAGYRVDDSEEQIRLLADMAMASAIGRSEYQNGVVQVSQESGGVSAPAVIVEYDCALGGILTSMGGTVTEDTGTTENRFLATATEEIYRFDRCRLGNEPVVEADGLYLRRTERRIEDGVEVNLVSRRWSDFSARGALLGEFAVDGETRWSRTAGDDVTDERSVNFEYYAEAGPDGRAALLVSNARADVQRRVREEGLYEDYAMEVSGQVVSPATDGISVDVFPATAFLRTLSTDPDRGADTRSFEGRLEMQADQTLFVVTAHPEPGPDDALLVDTDLLLPDGTARKGRGVPLVDLPLAIFEP